MLHHRTPLNLYREIWETQISRYKLKRSQFEFVLLDTEEFEFLDIDLFKWGLSTQAMYDQYSSMPAGQQMQSNALQHTATHCNLQDSAKHWKTLPDTARHCNTLQHSTRHCNTLQHTASQTHWNTLHHTATRCNTLQHTATHTAIHCNTLRHKQTETHCIALQHAVTHCNTLQHTAIHYITLDTLTPRLRGGKCKALGNTLFFSSCIDPTVKT